MTGSTQHGDGAGDVIGSIEFDRCAACGEPLDAGEWQPVESVRDGDALRLRAFCDDDCRERYPDSE